jgi:hypothetical protein
MFALLTVDIGAVTFNYFSTLHPFMCLYLNKLYIITIGIIPPVMPAQ